MSTPLWMITGGSMGLGHAIATAVLEHGHRVVLTASTPGPLETLAGAHPKTCFVAALDMTKPEQLAKVVDEAEAISGPSMFSSTMLEWDIRQSSSVPHRLP